jgi:hypothetical protein
MSAPLQWSILIPTLAGRQASLARLLDVLLPQAEAVPGIEVVALYNNGSRPLTDIRQDLLDDARGEFISFIDDDDLVVPDFAYTVIMAMGDPDTDAVGFQARIFEDGDPVQLAFHSIRFTRQWFADISGAYRDWTLLNPVRTAIARKGDFRLCRELGEDYDFRSQIAHLLHRDEYIPRVLYLYYSSPAAGHRAWSAPGARPVPALPRPAVASPAFRWHEASLP